MTGGDDRERTPASSRAVALLVAVVTLLPLATLINGRATPWYPRVVVTWILTGGVIVGGLLLAARLLPAALERSWRELSRRVMRIPDGLFVGACALFAFALAAWISTSVFGRQPHDVDEAAQLFHAKILASGRLSLAADPNGEFFAMDDMIDRGRWYSHFSIGGPALLALGVLVRAAWLVGPVLLALTVVGVHRFARRVYGAGVARASALLLAITPFALFISASYMNHIAALCLATLALTQLASWDDARDVSDRNRSGALLGLAVGGVFAIRPLDGIVLAMVVGVFQLLRLRDDPSRTRSLSWQLAAGLIPVAMVMYVNARTTGSPFRFGYDVLYGAANRLGFHADPYGVPHTPRRAFTFFSRYLLQLDVVLLLWPLPAFGIIVAGWLALKRPSRWDYLLLGYVGAQTVAYSLYWAEGMFRGPRYLFTVVVAMIVLIARAPFLVAAASRGALGRAAPFILPACALVAWLPLGANTSVPGYTNLYRRMGTRFRIDPEASVHAAGVQRALVFVNEDARSRTLHRLWHLGVGRGDALRLMDSAPVCGVHLAVDAEERHAAADTAGRLQRLIANSTAFDTMTALPAVCEEDGRRDASGTHSFIPFFAANTIGSDGRIGGDIVYALDLGAHNEALRSRFGDRPWYRAGARTVGGGAIVSMTPYDDPPRR